MVQAMMLTMPAPVKALMQEAESSQQFTTDGSLAVLSFKFAMSTLQSAIGTQMAAAFAPGGGPPGMQPGTPPGDQPKNRGGDGGGGRRGGGGKGGRGKGKGGS
jgi:hypothetical protein